MKKVIICALMASMLAMVPAVVSAQNTITIQANEPAANISSNLFGIFFEEINMAGDGGIYAELVRNCMFADSTNSIPWWSFVSSGSASGSMSLDSSMPLSQTNPDCCLLTMTHGSGSVGIANDGYYGIPVTSGKTYNLGFYARANSGFGGSITASLESSNDATVYAQQSISGLTTGWQHFNVSFVPNATDPHARLVLRISQAGSIYLDVVTLFPAQTFHNRTNGLRPDLANMLVNLHPSFMRFPGGSWVDGTSLADAYHWNLTIGPLQDRTERNNVWGYMVDNGLGYEEYLQMCQDIGTQPLLCVNCGMDVHQNAVPPGQLGPWVQEALGAIQYANGSTNTYWGAKRAADGHPAPFNLQYIEIGNENGGSAYNTNYAMFYHAIKAQYPAMHIIADNWGGIPSDAPVHYMDEHFYNSASWFEQNANMFDTYSRTGPKVFVGEYAVAYAIPPNTYPATLNNALGEAAWMTGLERNSDIVKMACYAPLFCNLNNPNWYPDLIYFNGTNVFGTPSYYVQQMFSLNRGDVVLPTTVSTSGNPLYVSSSLVQSTGGIIVKAVNVNSSAMTTTINMNGVTGMAPMGTDVQLAGNPNATNSLTAPTAIAPVTNLLSGVGTSYTVTLPANSVTVFRLQAAGFNAITNLQLQFNSPLHVGQEATVSLSGQAAGQTFDLIGNHAVTYSSLNTNVAVITADGVVIGAGTGTTGIVAAYDGLTATQTVQVLSTPPTRLIHRYSFNNGTADDSVGTNNGTFYNASGAASIANGQLNLVGNAGDYVDLGPGLITATNFTTGAITIEAWASFNTVNGKWARLFDFGNISGSSGGNYIFLTPNNANNGGNTVLSVSGTMPGSSDAANIYMNNLLGQNNMQIAVVFNPAPGRQFLGLYTNGVLAASTSTAGQTIASIHDVFSFLGHSLWSADAWLNGSIDEFRIYDGELNKFQVAATYQAGPNSTNIDLGTATGLRLQPGASPLALSSPSQLAAYLNFTVAGSVSVIGDPDLTLTSDNTNVLTVDTSGKLLGVGLGSAQLTGVYDYLNGNTSTFYTNTVTIQVAPPSPPVLKHRYSFSDANGGTSVTDSMGGAMWDGTVMSGGTSAIPTGGAFTNGVLYLSASNQNFVQLPQGILGNYPAVTIEGWVTELSAMSAVQYSMYYAFGTTQGSTGYNYIFGSLPRVYTAISPGTYSAEQGTTESDYSLASNTPIHWVAVYNPPAGYIALYTNGVLQSINHWVTQPMSVVSPLESFIGRSLYTSDPYASLALNEFRIYDGAMTPQEVAATQVLGPNQLLTTNAATMGAAVAGSQLKLSWPLAAAGFLLESRTNLSVGTWQQVTAPAPQIIGNQWQITLPTSENTEFFRLTE